MIVVKFLFITSIIYITQLCKVYAQDLNFSIYDTSGIVFRIYNGQKAKLGDYPYQIGFKAPDPRTKSSYYTFCGGTIITDNKVLSAAHCFENSGRNLCQKFWKLNRVRSVSNLYAVAAYLRNNGPYSKTEGQWIPLKSVRLHGKYKFPINDIAIVTTAYDFEFNDHVKKLPIATRFIEYKGTCIASGYGRTSDTTTSDVLLWANVDVIPTAKANSVHKRNMRNFVCISGYADVGKGDSGGPLVCKNTGDPAEGPLGLLVGAACGIEKGKGSFFTRVSQFKNFVDTSGSMYLKPSSFFGVQHFNLLISLTTTINHITISF